MTEENEAMSSTALVLEYNKDSGAVDVFWNENVDDESIEPAYVTSVPVQGEPTDEEVLAIGQQILDSVLNWASAVVQAIDEEDVDEDVHWADEYEEPENLQHNHLTRDLKAPGECPACDPYWERHP